MSKVGRVMRSLMQERDTLVVERDLALEEVRRLQDEVVRLHAKVQVLEDRQRLAADPVPRGLASLIRPEARGA